MLTPNVAQHFFPANILSALNHFVAKNVSGATFGSVIATFAMQHRVRRKDVSRKMLKSGATFGEVFGKLFLVAHIHITYTKSYVCGATFAVQHRVASQT